MHSVRNRFVGDPTMIYTHVLNRDGSGILSPLDD